MADELRDAIAKLSEKVSSCRGDISTEEATKTAFILPFIQILGYDIFDPHQVVPEFVADIGIKAGEKVDYAIKRDDKPIMLIECKSCDTTLCVENESQLFRYFHTSDAKFAILTNGIEYRFYSDLDEPNKMDTKPFLEFSMLKPDKINFAELEKFTNDKFNADSIRRSADHLKKLTAIRSVIKAELKEPSAEFVKMIFRKISPSGACFYDRDRNELTPLVKSVVADTINDLVKAELANAMKNADQTSDKISEETAPREQTDGIVTTADEIAGYIIIKTILHGTAPADKVMMKDWKSYCAINFGPTGWKPICRLYFNNPQNLRVGLFDGEQERRVSIKSPDDIAAFADAIIAAAKKYI